MRGGGRSSGVGVRSALRRELARQGGEVQSRAIEFAPFECFSLCMACGRLVEPTSADPMRSAPADDRSRSVKRRCPACQEIGLVDLRHTPSVYSLSEVEEDESKLSRSRRRALAVALVPAVALMGWLAYSGFHHLMREAHDATSVIVQVACSFIVSAVLGWALSQVKDPLRRTTPRRWRLPEHGLRPSRPRRVTTGVVESAGELLRAPLSGRPCLAYEVAAREDDDAGESAGSWRLLEQDNAALRVGGVDVPRGHALLRLPRQLSSAGLIMERDEPAQQYLRMRGLLETEYVHIYETILAPGETCSIGRRDATEPHQILAA
ncbi:hypothetical protein G6O69_10615 [Pseudenhygromyxa sp. WMMC2535]|uniref:hypothetical protein n=1 Tax=Pseudenhygromyxa sp. WMMC2535 TaxID=2712867 RepID=UPI001551DFC5|nr:hypothetical protein [Pseudenhygromyxa sp. WMMC2535]NVB38284.1 hypothetical protein [Pseudenhygromyxa sp. WMMC2535]